VAKNPAIKLFGLVWPVAMFFAVVMTGNHFVLDTVLGAIVSFAGLGIAFGLERARPKAMAWLRRGSAARPLETGSQPAG
jgi:hypothetical protein